MTEQDRKNRVDEIERLWSETPWIIGKEAKQDIAYLISEIRLLQMEIMDLIAGGA